MPANEKPIELEIEVFKTGTHTDSSGDERDWTLDDLTTIANTYNEAITADPGAEAPIVKGHPDTDDPAFGWVKSLKVVGDKLKAKITLIKDFAEDVKNELYKKVSIALREDMMLRHIGFLGAVHPAVKGLEPVKFSEGKFKTWNFEAVGDNLPTDSSVTVEQAKAEQDARAKSYGIGVKDKIGYIQKPEAYASLTDDDFADPTNYLYPIHDLPNLIASKETFRGWDNSYTDVERQVILARFLKAAQAQGIDIIKDRLYFSEDTTFSISLNENLKREKPTTYSDYLEGDFGDPVHFRFPLKTKSNVKASMAIFSRDNVKTQYSEKEQQYIAARIIKAAQNQGITLTPKNWAYVDVEIPVQDLSRKQLENYVNKSIQKIQTNNSLYAKGTTMNEWLTAFITAMTQKLSEAGNEEIATQFQAWVDEYKTANPLPAESAPAGGTENSDPPIPKEYAERMEKLEKDNRTMKYEQYFNEQVVAGKLVPAQKELVLATLEMGHDKSFKFAEKETNVADLVKNLIGTFPKQVEFNEFANGGQAQKATPSIAIPEGTTIDEESNKLHEKVMAFMDEEKKQGKELTYKQALRTVTLTNS